MWLLGVKNKIVLVLSNIFVVIVIEVLLVGGCIIFVDVEFKIFLVFLVFL